MRRGAILSFSARGAEMAARIAEALADAWEIECHVPHGNLKPLTAELFGRVDALIFVGACGIAVRAIAPLVASKRSDPAVIVLDECGRHVISLLSGHIGGANALAAHLAASIGGEAVITTATDVNQRFSVDAWAARNGLWISDMGAAKRFSAEILKRDLPIYSDFPVSGPLPRGVYLGDGGNCGAVISCRNIAPFEDSLLLVPKRLHLGIGCKRGTAAEAVCAAVHATLEGACLRKEALRRAASIDLKSDEEGLKAYCEKAHLPIAFYTASELGEVPGSFTGSAFVQRTVGVDNVCERSAMRSAGPGAKLLIQKTCLEGVTVAVAQEDWSVVFE